MKTKRFPTAVIPTTASAGSPISEAHAATINVNYDFFSSSTPAMAAADVAGLVPAANWNNVATTLSPPLVIP